MKSLHLSTKRLTRRLYPALLALLTLASTASAYDPNLIAWYKLDGQIAGETLDSSGYSRHAVVNGNPQWLAGIDGSAIALDGVDDSAAYTFGEQQFPACTIAFWVRTDTPGQDVYSSPFSSRAPSGAGFQIDVDGGSPGVYRVNPSALAFGPVTTDWVHLAVACNGTAATLYYNAIQTNTGQLDDSIFNQFAIGVNRNANNHFAGMVDDLRIYDKTLTLSAIQQLMNPDPDLAADPYPPDGSTPDPFAALPLTWTPGAKASGHHIYFAADRTAVENATPQTQGVYRGFQPVGDETYSPPEPLEFDTAYYWRIDQSNNDRTTTKGRIWTFQLPPHALLEDFQSYTDTNDLAAAWTSNENTQLALASESGDNHLLLACDNNQPPHHSQARLTFDPPADWTAVNAKALQLSFLPDSQNTPPASFAVILTDQSANTAAVSHPNPDALARLSWDRWQTWPIALSDFTDSGLDLTRITALTIEITDASGTVGIDNIALHPPRCLPDHIPTSFDDNCTTDLTDLELIMQYWLASDYTISSAAPDSSALLGHYTFDETAGLTAADSSPRDNHADLDPNAQNAWDPAGRHAGCLDFDGSFAVSVPNNVFAEVTDRVTIAVWLRTDPNSTPNAASRTQFSAGPADPNAQWDTTTSIDTQPAAQTARWDHYAFVKDAAAGTMAIYRNALLIARTTDAGQPMNGPNAGPTRIGAHSDGQTGRYRGKMDDFRIYNYALGQNEILHLAAGPDTHTTQPLKPVLAPIDPTNDGRIDFRDFALMAQYWLKDAQWPPQN